MRGVMHIELEDAYGVKTGVVVTVIWCVMNTNGREHYKDLHWSIEPNDLPLPEQIRAFDEADTIFWQRVGLGKLG